MRIARSSLALVCLLLAVTAAGVQVNGEPRGDMPHPRGGG